MQVSSQDGKQYNPPDMVGYKGQSGAWTDNETDPVTTTQLKPYSPALWTGERYYDPSMARHLTREDNAAFNMLQPDVNLYSGDPNPIGHFVGGILAGTAGTLLGGPVGSAAAVGAWEGLYSYALGEPIETVLTQGVISGITDYAGGKLFHFAAEGIGAGISSIAKRLKFNSAQLDVFGGFDPSKPNIVYRALREGELESIDAGQGITRPNGRTTLNQHLQGAHSNTTPWISTTRSTETAELFATHGYTKPAGPIISIDLNKVTSQVFDVSHSGTSAFRTLRNPFAIQNAIKHREVSILGYLNQEAITILRR